MNLPNACRARALPGICTELESTSDLESTENENRQGIPVYELPAPKKKRTVYIWACCCCPTSGMKVSTVDCPGCGTPRCPYCRVEKKTIRG
ncbi:hypothetical protein NXS19_006382 [Fusarium pseudograminearum]|nr:hypothetical protein NXS19_006382 [Fusarium pseudograminearum]